jgi:RNA polymerase sigma-70 factor (ECF subfamily)
MPDETVMPSRLTDERNFPNTSWTLIRQSQDVADPAALTALDRLARADWRPLVVFARSTGLDEARAQDEVQRMFESLLSRDSLRTVSPGESRFRSFLIQCLRNTMTSTLRDSGRQKRGGGLEHEELDAHATVADAAAESPELALDRAWAVEVFEKAFLRLEEDAAERGRAEVFAVLKPILRGKSPRGGYEALAEKMAVSEGTARKMVFDLRARLGVMIRQEVSATVADPAEVEDELKYLMGLL